MPLPKPTLDNRRFDQLVSECRGLIPRLAPQWTDQNASDPGITLLELGAWLAEQNIYRFDRLSDEAMRAFARRVSGEPQKPAVARDLGSGHRQHTGVARTVVAIHDPNRARVRLPSRMRLASVARENRVEIAVERFESTDPYLSRPRDWSDWSQVARPHSSR